MTPRRFLPYSTARRHAAPAEQGRHNRGLKSETRSTGGDPPAPQPRPMRTATNRGLPIPNRQIKTGKSKPKQMRSGDPGPATLMPLDLPLSTAPADDIASAHGVHRHASCLVARSTQIAKQGGRDMRPRERSGIEPLRARSRSWSHHTNTNELVKRKLAKYRRMLL